MKIQALRARAKQTSMSSSADDVLGLRDEVARLRVAIERLRSDVRAAVRTQEHTPGRRLSGRQVKTENLKEESRQEAVVALARALVAEIEKHDANVNFGPPGLAAFPASTSLLGPRGPVATLLLAGLTLLQRQNAPVASIVTAPAPPAWSPTVTDVDASAANVTLNTHLVNLNNETDIGSAADAVLNASTWATTTPDEDMKRQVESMTDEALQEFMNEANEQAARQLPTSVVSQQPAAPSAPSPPSSSSQPDAGASRGWGSITGGALSFIQNNPLAQTIVLEIAKRVKKALGSRTATPGSEAEPAAEPAAETAAEPAAGPVSQHAAAQEPLPPHSVDDDNADGKDVFLDAPEEQVVDDATTRAELLIQEAATAPPDSPSAVGDEQQTDEQQTDPKRTLRSVSLLRVASTATDDEAGSQPSTASSASFSEDSSLPATPSSAASSAYPLPFHHTLEQAAHEHADAACGDAPGERAEVVNEVIQLVQYESDVDANYARTRLEGALNEACEARARGILEGAILDAQSLRERVKLLAKSFNHT